jgi:predicted ATP-grasp superfamily ATP-dependent carboligase
MGGLENRPRLLGQLAEIHPLLGTAPATVRRVRDPWELNRVLTAAGFPLPEIQSTPDATADPAAWLWKPLRSAGGRGIGHADRPGRSRGYFQRFVPGDVLGATYLGTPTGVRLLGVSQQLSGPAWGQAPGFAYGGSIGPLRLPPRRSEQLEALGRVLGDNFALVGLFGVDLVDDGRQFWPLEVNPRFTASVEVLELALGQSLMAEHLAACPLRAGPLRAPCPAVLPPAAPLLGKAIVYASRPWTVSAARFQRLCDLHERRPLHLAADLPTPGSIIPPGAPIATVFAWGDTIESVRAALRERLAACRDE